MSQFQPTRCAVVGASGGIGAAFVKHLAVRESVERVYAFSRTVNSRNDNSSKVIYEALDYARPDSIEDAAGALLKDGPLDLIIVATGLLHSEDIKPEKSLRELSVDQLQQTYLVNCIGPALVMKAFLPILPKEGKSVFATLSARVGSISDNRIGGWYGYRAAKAGLNQMLRTASIEHRRRWKDSVVMGLHPGTVNTDLSKPFQRNVADGKLFTPDYSATAMLNVIDSVTAEDSGKVLAYDGSEVPA